LTRKQRGGQGRPGIPGGAVPQVDAELHVWWDQPARMRGPNVFCRVVFLWLETSGSSTTAAGQCRPVVISIIGSAPSWMARYALNAHAHRAGSGLQHNPPVIQDIATEYSSITLSRLAASSTPPRSRAWSHVGGEDGGIVAVGRPVYFFYDVLHFTDGSTRPLKVRSMVGLIPHASPSRHSHRNSMKRLLGFKRLAGLNGFLANRPVKLGRALVSARTQKAVVTGACCPWVAARCTSHEGLSACTATCLTRPSSSRPYGVRALSRVTALASYLYSITTALIFPSATSRPNPTAGCSGGNSNLAAGLDLVSGQFPHH